MSQLYEQRWQVERERKRKAYLNRVRQSTTHYHRRHASMLSELRAQGLEQYLPGEFGRISARLARIESLITTDPEKARDLNLALAAEVSSLPGMARAARHEFQLREQERQRRLAELRRQATSDLARFIVDKMYEFTDPIEQDFAFEGLRALQAEFAGKVVDPGELARQKGELERRFEDIQNRASAEAQSWKESRSKTNSQESLEVLLSMHKEQLAAGRERAPAEVDALLARLDALAQESRAGGISEVDLQQQLAQLGDASDVALADEECRREVVRSLVETLGNLGFVVRPPQRESGHKDEVLISARKPAGQAADFRIAVDGHWTAKFERYEGMGCKDDIDKMDAMLQEIYGISLSDKRVEWQNPDRRSLDERPIDPTKGQHGHG